MDNEKFNCNGSKISKKVLLNHIFQDEKLEKYLLNSKINLIKFKDNFHLIYIDISKLKIKFFQKKIKIPHNLTSIRNFNPRFIQIKELIFASLILLPPFSNKLSNEKIDKITQQNISTIINIYEEKILEI